MSTQDYVVVLGFALLDEHDAVHDVDYVEVTNVFAEFTSFYLSEVEEVLDNVGKDAARRLLDQVAIVQFRHDLLESYQKLILFGHEVLVCYLAIKLGYHLIELFIEFILQYILSIYRIQRISHFMRHTCIYHF